MKTIIKKIALPTSATAKNNVYSFSDPFKLFTIILGINTAPSRVIKTIQVFDLEGLLTNKEKPEL